MADIFLSYNEKDRGAVSRLAELLQSMGWSVWWDRRIPAGSTWRSVLERELQDMRCMVVLWSHNSVRSEWVCEEASEGRQLGRLVPASIDRVRPPAGFREIQAADLVGWDGSRDFVGLQRLLEDIERLIGKPCTPTPDTSKPEAQVDTGALAAIEGQVEDDALPVRPDALPNRCLEVPTTSARRLLLWSAAALLVLVAAGVHFGRSQPEPADAAKQAAEPSGRVAPPLPTSAPAELGKTSAAPSETLQPHAAIPLKPAVTATLPLAAVSQAASPSTGSSAKRVKASALVSPRCAALLERLSLGETLSGPSQSFFNQECRQ